MAIVPQIALSGDGREMITYVIEHILLKGRQISMIGTLINGENPCGTIRLKSVYFPSVYEC